MVFKVTAKLVEFKKAKMIKLVQEADDETIDVLSKLVRGYLREEVPVDTGNLRDTQIIGEIARVGEILAVNVGSDEDEAPYAPFVFFPGVTRKYAGNDWIKRVISRVLRINRTIIRQAEQRIFSNLQSL